MFTGDCCIESSDLAVLSLQNAFGYGLWDRSADCLLFIKTTQKVWNSKPSIRLFYITTHHALRVSGWVQEVKLQTSPVNQTSSKSNVSQ